MQYRNPQKLQHELVVLIEKQIESLEKQTFEGCNRTERHEYEERQIHIDELCEELRSLHPAAWEPAWRGDNGPTA
jgi:hypothetical protein